jgi:hypothetical protein
MAQQQEDAAKCIATRLDTAAVGGMWGKSPRGQSRQPGSLVLACPLPQHMACRLCKDASSIPRWRLGLDRRPVAVCTLHHVPVCPYADHCVRT